ncbi:hypothetical protein EYY84_12835 [Hafnia alvei]|nr:RHS repeat-associated core domain-containing protein [Hafnia alvei]TBM12764.1 hypothetical protein EYY84_12835 [Hafnia alvei]
MNSTGSDDESCRLRFPGQYEDDESGLFYNRYRYYDSETGQYVSPDPIGLEGGLNLYSYVKNPLTWIDPLGLTSCQLSAAMEKNGTSRPANSAAHHIVPETAKGAQPARNILNKYDLLNSHENGAFLPNRNNTDLNVPGIMHNGRHPDPYLDALNRRIENADVRGGKLEVIRELDDVRGIILSADRNASWYDIL